MKTYFLLPHALQTKSGILQVAAAPLFEAATARHVQVPTGTDAEQAAHDNRRQRRL